MSRQYKSLIEARDQWQRDIKMYKDFLQGETKTFEGRYGAEAVSYTHLTLPTTPYV